MNICIHHAYEACGMDDVVYEDDGYLERIIIEVRRVLRRVGRALTHAAGVVCEGFPFGFVVQESVYSYRGEEHHAFMDADGTRHQR